MRYFSILVIHLILVVGVAITSIVGSAEAQERDIYWGLSLGPHFVFDNGAGDDEVKFDTGVAGALQIGYLFDDLRTDIEFSYSRSDVDKVAGARSDGDLQTFKVTANLYFECNDPLDWLRIDCVDAIYYGGVGIGVAHQVLNDGLDDEETGLTLHGEVGITFKSSRYIDFVTAYRVELFEAELEDLDERTYAHTLRVGARFYY